jgi:hypothetical protein
VLQKSWETGLSWAGILGWDRPLKLKSTDGKERASSKEDSDLVVLNLCPKTVKVTSGKDAPVEITGERVVYVLRALGRVGKSRYQRVLCFR